MKKKTKFLIAAVILILCAIGSNTDSETDGKAIDTKISNDEPSWTVSEADILPILFHQPYLDATNISVNYESDRGKMPDKIAKALQGTPYRAIQKDGGLFGTDYYAITSGSSGYYYYGKTSDNRPDGFGVLARNPINLDDLDSIDGLVYAGNFKKGIFNGYGAQFNSASINASTYVYGFIFNGWLEEKYANIAISYLQSYIVYDGSWQNGKEDGKGNYFQLDDYLLLNSNVQDNYWGGMCYPIITVTDVNKSLVDGDTKQYVCGVLVYDGKTKSGAEDGKGISYYSNGQVKYDGQWKNGKYDGKGKLYDTDGTLIYSGKWKKGDYAS